MKLLIVEDNPHLSEDMKRLFEDSGFLVERVYNLCDAMEKIGGYDYELVIIDLGLPDGNGLKLINQLKADRSKAGVLIVTARDKVEDKVKALELGADDYLTKPFHQSELLARVRSIIRRRSFDGEKYIVVNQLKADPDFRRIYVKDSCLDLTPKEFDFLLYLMYNKNRILTKESIAEHLWGDHIDQADSFDFIYNHVKNVRKKILKAGGGNSIQSVYGLGYRMVEIDDF